MELNLSTSGRYGNYMFHFKNKYWIDGLNRGFFDFFFEIGNWINFQ